MTTSTNTIWTGGGNVSNSTPLTTSATYYATSNTATATDNWSVHLNTSDDNIYINDMSVYQYVQKICDDAIQKNNKNENKKENKPMVTKYKNMEFGPVDPSVITLSAHGLAVHRSDDTWVTYKDNSMEIVSVDGLVFPNTSNMIWAIPVALKDLTIGDLVLHNKHACYITNADDISISVVDVTDGTIKEIIPTKSPFGFTFMTKIVSLINFDTASADSPFGDNFLTYLLLSNSDNQNLKDMLPLILMSNKDNKINPLMLTLFSK